MDGDVEVVDTACADEFEREFVFGAVTGEGIEQVVAIGERGSGHIEQDVANQDSGLFGKAVALNVEHEQTRELLNARTPREGGFNLDGTNANTEFDSLGRLTRQPFGGDMTGDGDGLIATQDHGVEADDVALSVDQGTAGVAGAQAHIGAEVGHGLFGVADFERANGTDDAAGDQPLLAPRVADGPNGLTDAGFGRIVHFDGGQASRLDTQHGEIEGGVAARDSGLKRTAIVEFDMQTLATVGDDVEVGQDTAIGTPDDSRPGTPAFAFYYHHPLTGSVEH